MSEKAETVEMVPFAELVIRPADSRPIVITLGEPNMGAYMSDGDVDDCHFAETVLNVIANVIQSTYIMRRLIVDLDRVMKGSTSEGFDDPPW